MKNATILKMEISKFYFICSASIYAESWVIALADKNSCRPATCYFSSIPVYHLLYQIRENSVTSAQFRRASQHARLKRKFHFGCHDSNIHFCPDISSSMSKVVKFWEYELLANSTG